MSTTTAPPARPRPRRTPQREPVTVLVTVCLDRQASTPWHELYHASSDSTIGRVYEVRRDVARNAWTCQCVGFQHHGRCCHTRRCKRLQAVQWHHALRLGVGPHDLRRERDHLLVRVADEQATEDDLCALDSIALLLGERVAA